MHNLLLTGVNIKGVTLICWMNNNLAKRHSLPVVYVWLHCLSWCSMQCVFQIYHTGIPHHTTHEVVDLPAAKQLPVSYEYRCGIYIAQSQLDSYSTSSISCVNMR